MATRFPLHVLPLQLLSQAIGQAQEAARAYSGTQLTVEIDGKAVSVRVPLNPQLSSVLNVAAFDGERNRQFDVKLGDFFSFKPPEPLQALEPLFTAIRAQLKAWIPALADLKPAPAVAPAPAVEPAPPTEAQEVESAYKGYVIPQTDGPNLRFEGKELAAVRTLRGYRGHAFLVFQTKGGKYIGVKQGLSSLPGERTLCDAKQLSGLDSEALTEFFGHSRLAKALYQQLGVADELVID